MRIAAELRLQMIAHVQNWLPEEACGLLGGTPDEARRVFAVENELHSPVRFLMRGEDQLKAFLQIEAEGLELVGIFHSHPSSPAYPSPTDVSEFLYPEVLTLILSPDGGSWQMSAFQIENGQITPIEIEE